MKKLITKIGEITNISFRNIDGWAVFIIKDDNGERTPCTGILPSMVDVKYFVTCEGEHIENKYGIQLKCSSVTPVPPDTGTDSGVIRLLTLLPGIGIKKATAAVEELGASMAWDTAKKHPSYLGITNYEKALKVQETAVSLMSSYKAITYLLGLGLTENQSNKIIKKYGVKKAIKQVSEEPYSLIDDIDGFGFRIVDGISLKAGIKSNSDQRILACILFCLNDSEKNQGHVWFYGKNLMKIVADELVESGMSQNVPVTDIDLNRIRQLIYQLGDSDKIVINKGKVFSKNLLNAERRILDAVRQ